MRKLTILFHPSCLSYTLISSNLHKQPHQINFKSWYIFLLSRVCVYYLFIFLQKKSSLYFASLELIDQATPARTSHVVTSVNVGGCQTLQMIRGNAPREFGMKHCGILGLNPNDYASDSKRKILLTAIFLALPNIVQRHVGSSFRCENQRRLSIWLGNEKLHTESQFNIWCVRRLLILKMWCSKLFVPFYLVWFKRCFTKHNVGIIFLSWSEGDM